MAGRALFSCFAPQQFLRPPFFFFEKFGKLQIRLSRRGKNPIVAKVGGLQSQGAKGAAVVDLLQALGNAGSGVLRLSRRGKKMA
jgi:hypothetical protein